MKAAAAFTLILLFTIPASAEWETPIVIGGTSGTPIEEELRTASNGDDAAIAIWLETVGGIHHVMAAVYGAGGWKPAADVSGSTGLGAIEPDVAMGTDGRAAVVWQVDDSPQRIYVARFDGTGWSVPERLDDPSKDLFKHTPRVGAGPDGKFFVAWCQDAAVVRRFDGAAWASEEMLSSGLLYGLPGQWGDVGMDPVGGRAAVAWSQHDGEAFRVFARRWDGTRWSAEQAIEAEPHGESWDPRVEVADGDTTVAWFHDIGSEGTGVFYAEFEDQFWGRSHSVSYQGGSGSVSAFELARWFSGVAIAHDKATTDGGGVFLLEQETTGRTTWGGRVDGMNGPANPAVALSGWHRGFVAFSEGGALRARSFDDSQFGETEEIAPGWSTNRHVKLAAVHEREMLAVFSVRTAEGERVVASLNRAPDPFDPVITKVKVKGDVAAGAKVTLKGINFGVEEGTVTAGGAPVTLKKWSSRKLIFFLPGGAGFARLEVRSKSDRRVSMDLDYALPVLTKLKPKAPRPAGKTLTLKGTSFGSADHDPGCFVRFGDTEIGPGSPLLVKWKSKSVKVRIPEGTGTVNVTVRTAAGETAALPFTIR